LKPAGPSVPKNEGGAPGWEKPLSGALGTGRETNFQKTRRKKGAGTNQDAGKTRVGNAWRGVEKFSGVTQRDKSAAVTTTGSWWCGWGLTKGKDTQKKKEIKSTGEEPKCALREALCQDLKKSFSLWFPGKRARFEPKKEDH